MVKYIGKLLRELNPLHDMHRLQYAFSRREYDASRLLNTGKSVLRGASGGGLVGAVVGLLSPADAIESAVAGALVGAVLDTVQYNIKHTLFTVIYPEVYKNLRR